MKKLVTFALAALVLNSLSATAHAAQQTIWDAPDGYRVTNPALIRRAGGFSTIMVWDTPREPTEVDGATYQSFVMMLQFDCNSKVYRTTKLIGASERDGRGAKTQIIRGDASETSAFGPISGGAAEATFKVACAMP